MSNWRLSNLVLLNPEYYDRFPPSLRAAPLFLL
jgi:hypothetical protein